MKTQDVIKSWRNEKNYCEPRGDYYFNLHKGVDEIATRAREHDMVFLMRLGRRLPGTKNHANYWVKNGLSFDVIGTHEILPFYEYCKMIGFEPEFKFTKSETFVRCINQNDLTEAIKNYFK